MDLLACFSSVFLDFQLTNLSKMPSFQRKSAFDGYFVVSNNLSIKRFCILLVVEQSCGARSFYIEHTDAGYVILYTMI